MKKVAILIIIIFELLTFGGCGDSTDFEVKAIIPTGDENYLILDSDHIFDQDVLHTFELNIPTSSLAQIDGDPAAEEYVEASLTFAGETISPIGVRYKGSIGAFVDCLSDPDWWEPSGYKICTKLSMKVKINWGENDKFYGLKKLQFHAQNLDPTQMHERLGYWLFREMGVPAPRSVHARLIINGVYSGLYALTEQIDGRFTRYNFKDGKGNLYKEIWPLTLAGQPHPEQSYLARLKTNEDENPSAELIKRFAQEIADSDDDTIQATISKWMNVEQIIAYAVVDRAIRNDDGAFHWYCGDGGCENHNYYWYEETDVALLHLVPWDLDNAFENIVRNANPVTPIADGWGEITADCRPFKYGALGIEQRSAACDKLTAGWAGFTDEYKRMQMEFMNGPFSTEQVNDLLDTWEAQIRAATVGASQAHEDALSIFEWESALRDLRVSLKFARER